MLRSLSIGSYLCNDTGRFVEGRDTWSFPDATPNADGTAAQLARAVRYAKHYNDAPWQFTQVFSSADRAQLDAFISALVPGAYITLEEDTGTSSSRIVSVDSTLVSTKGFTRVMVSGTRSPAWRDIPYPFSLTVAGGMGTVAAPTVGGTLAAELDITALSSADTPMLAVGIQHKPAAGYAPHLGVPGTPSVWSANVPLSTAPTLLFTPAELLVSANRGAHYGVLVARHDAPAGTLKYRLGSTLLGASAPCPYPVVSPSTAPPAEVLVIGKVSIPAAMLPTSADGFVYGAEITSAFYTAAPSTAAIGYGVGQTFPFAGGMHTGVTFKVKNNANYARELVVELLEVTGVTPDSIPRAGHFLNTAITIPALCDYEVRVTWSNVQPGSPSAFYVKELVNGSLVNSDLLLYQDNAAGYTGGNGITYSDAWGWRTGRYNGSTLTAFDLFFTALYRPGRNFYAKIPITATCSVAGKVAATSTFSLIPADYGCIIVQYPFAGVGGWKYDAATRSVYPADSVGVSGPAISTSIKDGAMELPVGDNSFVVTGYLATVTLTGTITEQRITRG